SGLTYAETAALLGVEVGAVKTRLHKARRTLRKRLWTTWREEDMTAATDAQLVDMRVADVRRAPAAGDKPERYLVLLEEVGGARRLPLWIGSFEGEALALALEGVQAPRPLAYTLAVQLLQAAGGRLREVHISRVQDGVIYAVAVVAGSGGGGDIDARPSDALNLAMVVGAPIRAEPGVLDAEAAMQASAPERTRGMQSAFYGAGSVGAADIAAEIAARFAAR
ncbi:MAG TPA: bifunctional nuclease domain-containing protein, partial [Thermomicrobiales bacterium]|nr:bifunctional nuclease domain-containing protein [Thermomicrobiales bacterium]